jgi:hypothetical protein
MHLGAAPEGRCRSASRHPLWEPTSVATAALGRVVAAEAGSHKERVGHFTVGADFSRDLGAGLCRRR